MEKLSSSEKDFLIVEIERLKGSALKMIRSFKKDYDASWREKMHEIGPLMSWIGSLDRGPGLLEHGD